MILKILLVSILVTIANTESSFKSRAVQNFACNCLFNEYMHDEYKLGLFYLNASNHMFEDRVALIGFGKMFKSFWYKQLDQFNSIRKHIIKRGGLVQLKKVKLSDSSHDYFVNELKLIEHVLHLENRTNSQLIELHNCTSNSEHFELKCRQMHKRFKTLPLNENNDPHSSSFLDDNFTFHKVDRIKYLADLYERLRRLDAYLVHNGHVTEHLGLNQLGVLLLDQELKDKSIA